MRHLFRILLALAALTPAVAPAQTSTILSEELPVLMVLEHREKDKILLANVPAKAGTSASPLKGRVLEKIRVLPGNALELPGRPGDITVEFQRGSGVEASTVCAITIRYFRDTRGLWVPHFQLNEEVFVRRDSNGRWRPIDLARGVPSPVVLTSNSLPNADGFYPMLEFGLTNVMVQIDAWTIR